MWDLLQVMQQDGYLSPNELIALKKACKELGESPVRLLRSLNIASPEQIQDYLQKYFGSLVFDIHGIDQLTEQLRDLLAIDLAIFYNCFPIGVEENKLYIAIEDPYEKACIDQLRFFIGQKIIPVAATVFQLAAGITKIYGISLNSLKLSTSIERSRGVVGGLRFQEHFIETVEINETFSMPKPAIEIKANQDLALDPIKNQSLPEMIMPFAQESGSPVFDFIDGSSGSVDPDLLKIESPEESKKEFELSSGGGLFDDIITPPVTEASTQINPVIENKNSNELAQDNTKPLMQENNSLEETVEEQTTKVSVEEELTPIPVQNNSIDESPSSVIDELLAQGEDKIDLDLMNDILGDSGESIKLEEVSAPLNEITSDEENLLSEKVSAPLNEITSDEENLLSEEVSAPLNEITSDEENLLSDNSLSELGDNNIKDLTKNEDELYHLAENLSSVVSASIVKLSMLTDKKNAVDSLNYLLRNLEITVHLTDETYIIEGNGFSITASLFENTLDKNPIHMALSPVIRKIIKMAS